MVGFILLPVCRVLLALLERMGHKRENCGLSLLSHQCVLRGEESATVPLQTPCSRPHPPCALSVSSLCTFFSVSVVNPPPTLLPAPSFGKVTLPSSSSTHCVLFLPWVPGVNLSRCICSLTEPSMRRVQTGLQAVAVRGCFSRHLTWARRITLNHTRPPECNFLPSTCHHRPT